MPLCIHSHFQFHWWQHPNVAALCVSERSTITSGYRNILQIPGILHLYGSQMTRSDDVVSKEKVAGCHVVPGVETKPKSCCLNCCMPTEQKTCLFALGLSIRKAVSRPLTGCDLDRWMAKHASFVAERNCQLSNYNSSLIPLSTG